MPCLLGTVKMARPSQRHDPQSGSALHGLGDGELAQDGESVEGLIIARGEDPRLTYALRATRGINFRRYEVDFRLC